MILLLVTLQFGENKNNTYVQRNITVNLDAKDNTHRNLGMMCKSVYQSSWVEGRVEFLEKERCEISLEGQAELDTKRRSRKDTVMGGYNRGKFIEGRKGHGKIWKAVALDPKWGISGGKDWDLIIKDLRLQLGGGCLSFETRTQYINIKYMFVGLPWWLRQ